MMPNRADPSLLSRWWWTVDRWTLGAIGLLMLLGIVLIQAAGSAVAGRIGLSPFYFFERHMIVLVVGLFVMLATSLLSPVSTRRLAVVGCLISLVLVAATLFWGVEIKGARRWLALPGLSFQPSEFLKPCLAVSLAWLLAHGIQAPGFPGRLLGLALLSLAFGLLLMQPDMGMTLLILFTSGCQLFMAGLSVRWVVAILPVGAIAAYGAYLTFPHVASRIDRFLDPASGDTYQVQRALEAFANGGLLGAGPGEGTVKNHLPDAHADFIFAVAGEEMGAIVCLFIIALFAFITIRGLLALRNERNLFALLAAGGLLVQMGMQAFINMGSALHLTPTKGMTLPFISYGGSSLWALALAAGMILSLTRKRYETWESLES